MSDLVLGEDLVELAADSVAGGGGGGGLSERKMSEGRATMSTEAMRGTKGAEIATGEKVAGVESRNRGRQAGGNSQACCTVTAPKRKI